MIYAADREYRYHVCLGCRMALDARLWSRAPRDN